MRAPPDLCPACGARDVYESRHMSGAGWRRVYRCRACGRQATAPGPTRRVAPVAALAGLTGGAWLYLRGRLG